MPGRENLKIEPFNDADHEAFDTPEYKQKIELTDWHKKTIKKQIIDLFKTLKDKRKPFEGEWDQLDSVYDGEIETIHGQQFNVHYGIMAEKIDNAVNRADMAFFDNERMFDISPRPGFEQEDGKTDEAADVCQVQSDFLDYANEEVIKPRTEVGLAFHSAFLKGNGWLFGSKRVVRKPIRERRVFKGNPIYSIPVDDKGNVAQVSKVEAEKFTKGTGQPFKYENDGIEEFLKAFPDYKGTGYVKKLHEGKEIKIVATYDEVVYNDPHFESVDLKDIWVDPAVNDMHELAKSKLLVHAKTYTYWEMKELEEKGEFENVDVILYKNDKDMQNGKKIPNAENLEHTVYRCSYWCKPSEGASKEEKLIFWITEKQEQVIGCERFQHDRIASEYLPFIVKKKKKGLYQAGVGKDLIDDNITLDLFVNFTLQVLYLHSIVTPICNDGSVTYEQFHNKEFVNGLPIMTDGTPIDFLANHMKYPDINSILSMMNKVEQRSGEKSNITHGMTGKESPTDPSAPASKTLALLGEGNFNFKQYINKLASTFNEIGYMELAMYHQMEKEDIKFRRKGDKFGSITRYELVARTEIQTQALAFAVDKLREKQELVAFYSMMRPEMNDMEQIINLRRIIGKSWSPKVRTNIDGLFPDLDDVKRKQVVVAIGAVDQYVKGVQEQAELSGVMPPFDPNALMATIQQATQDMANPPNSKEIARRDKEAKQGR